MFCHLVLFLIVEQPPMSTTATLVQRAAKNTQTHDTPVETIVYKAKDGGKMEDTIKVSRFSRMLLTLSIVSSFLYWTALVHPFSGTPKVLQRT